MNGMSHMKYMLLGGAGLFGVLLLFGLPLQTALFLAVVLACPLMMVFMMGGHSGHDMGGSNRDADERPHTHRGSGTGTDHHHAQS